MLLLQKPHLSSDAPNKAHAAAEATLEFCEGKPVHAMNAYRVLLMFMAWLMAWLQTLCRPVPWMIAHPSPAVQVLFMASLQTNSVTHPISAVQVSHCAPPVLMQDKSSIQQACTFNHGASTSSHQYRVRGCQWDGSARAGTRVIMSSIAVVLLKTPTPCCRWQVRT
jgi:hypothetical protein